MEQRTWQYHAVHFFGWFVQLLPYSWLLAAGSLLGKLAYSFSGRHRERAIQHVRETLGYTDEEARNLIRRMYQHIGKSALELLYSPKLLRNPKLLEKIIDFEAVPEFVEWAKSGKGGIFITAHYGNWEWLAMCIANGGVPVGTIVKFQPQPWVNALLNDGRRNAGVEVYPRTASGTEILAGIRSIKKGKFLGLLCDQDGGKDGVFLPFLGKMASTMAGPGIIAARTHSPVFPVFIQRRPNGGHRVKVGKAFPESDDPNIINQYIQAAIEDVIREKPEEWLWLQRRWNTQAPTEVETSE